MKHTYDIYRPQLMNNDVYRVNRAYYRAEDISFSPYATVSSLSKANKQSAPVVHLSADSAVFGSNFRFHKDVQPKNTETVAAQHTMFTRAVEYIRMAGLAIGATLRHAVASTRHMAWRPTKYRVDKGVYTDFHTRTFAATKIVAPVLVLFGITAAVVGGNVGSQPADSNAANTPTRRVAMKNTAAKQANPATVNPVAKQSPAKTASGTSVRTMLTNTDQSDDDTQNNVTQASAQSGQSSAMSNSGSETTTSDGSDGTSSQPGMGAGPGDGDTGNASNSGTDPTSNNSSDTTLNGSSDSGSTNSSGATSDSSVTVPAINLQLGDTQLLSTDSTTITL